jgi:ASC-1-like (ASCH) protein
MKPTPEAVEEAMKFYEDIVTAQQYYTKEGDKHFGVLASRVRELEAQLTPPIPGTTAQEGKE